MAEDMYRKIEKKILDLKEKEGVWKNSYREMIQQSKEFVKSVTKGMEEMEAKIESLQERDAEIERNAKKSSEKFIEMLGLMDKRISSLSDLTKRSSLKIDENTAENRRTKADILLQVNGMISKHEKTFDATLEKIITAVKKMEDETRRAESVYEKMVAARDFMQNAPVPVRQQIAVPPAQRPAEAPAPLANTPSDPPADFMAVPSSPPIRKRPRRMPVFDDDLDDMDVDDVMSGIGGAKGLNISVDDMHRNVSGIAEKLSAIEDAVSKMHVQRGNVEKLEDKIQAYTESVAGIHSRMDTIERAMRDGMTPMMESMKLLADAVKDLKGRPNPVIQKPSPPASRSKPETLRHTPVPPKKTQPFRYHYQGE